MKRLSIFALLTSASLFSSEGICPLCELHRAYNKEHPGDYEYYEDYEKATHEKRQPMDPLKKNSEV